MRPSQEKEFQTGQVKMRQPRGRIEEEEKKPYDTWNKKSLKALKKNTKECREDSRKRGHVF